MADDAAPFPYMRWAKVHLPPEDPRSLGLSGLPRPAHGEVPGLHDPFLADRADPRPALRAALAERYGMPGADHVHLALGTSHANFAATLAFARGGRIAVETPAYEALPRLAPAVGADLTTFRRRPETRWRIDVDELAAAVQDGIDLVAVTDLHNPSGTRLHPDDLDLLLDTVERCDAVLLVDEVYLDLDPHDRPSAATRHERVLATNSLTKSHGLWDLRVGWVLGHPDRILAIARWDDLVCPSLPLLPAKQALGYLPQARERLLANRTRAALLTDRVDAWVAARDDVWWTRPDAAFTGFLRLGTEAHPLDGDAVARDTLEASGVHVVPGTFFQAPGWLRISYMLADDELAYALGALGDALDRAGLRDPHAPRREGP